MMMYGYYDYGLFPFHVFGSLFMVLFWVFLFILMIRLFRASNRKGKHGMHEWFEGSNALEILKERYAKGEITREQFEQMKKDIE